MAYLVLSQDEQDDMLVETLMNQERDHYSHTVNLERYTSLLAALPDGAFKARIQNLRDETQSRLGEVNAIVEALTPQLPPPARITAAAQRLATREAAARGG